MAFSFRQIQYFVAAAENGAVSRAAHVLSISQSTMAESIRELEGDLGFPLFERKAQGVELTLKGNQFLRHARKILADVAEARRALSGDEATAAGRLAIGVTPLVAGYVLAEILARFRRAFPAVAVDIVEDSRDYLEHLLVNGELDVGVIVAGPEKDDSALKVEGVETSRYRVWLPTGHRLAELGRISVRELAADPLVLLNIDEIAETAEEVCRLAGRSAEGRDSHSIRRGGAQPGGDRRRRRRSARLDLPAVVARRRPHRSARTRRDDSRRSRSLSSGAAERRCRGSGNSSWRWRAPSAAAERDSERFFR